MQLSESPLRSAQKNKPDGAVVGGEPSLRSRPRPPKLRRLSFAALDEDELLSFLDLALPSVPAIIEMVSI